MDKLNKVSFGIRDIDKDEWDLFKYFASKRGKCANDQVKELISFFVKKSREE